MARFIFKTLLFFVIFLLANLLYLELIKRYDWNFAKVLETRTMLEKDFDIIILGNSLALDGINTEILGSAYNLSIGGATLNTNEKQLREYLASADSKPQKVIMGMASCIGEKYERNTIHPIIRYLDSNKFDSFYDLPMIQFRWMALVLIKRIFSKSHRSAQIVQGQLRIDRTVTDNSKYESQKEEELNKDFYEDLDALDRISEICLQNKIELIVIEMPGIKKTQNSIPIGPHGLEKFDFYNFNNADFCKIFDSKTHWLGGSHLNTSGAEVFTQRLKEVLLE